MHKGSQKRCVKHAGLGVALTRRTGP